MLRNSWYYHLIPLHHTKAEFSAGSLSKHHSWTRHGPLRKISCHPFLKIFVNLVSSVCGFISTCINVSSLVTEAHYTGEDIIKTVWVPSEGRGEGGRAGGNATLTSCLLRLRLLTPWESRTHTAGDNKYTGRMNSPALTSQVSEWQHFNDGRLFETSPSCASVQPLNIYIKTKLLLQPSNWP